LVGGSNPSTATIQKRQKNWAKCPFFADLFRHAYPAFSGL